MNNDEEHNDRTGEFVGGGLIALIVLIFLALLALPGCTSRGGFPRFLRHGEMSDKRLKEYYATNNVPIQK